LPAACYAAATIGGALGLLLSVGTTQLLHLALPDMPVHTP